MHTLGVVKLGLVLLGLSFSSHSQASGAAPEPQRSESAHRSWPRHTIDATSRGADGVRVQDVNHDGLLDVVTGWEEGGVVRVYLHPGPAMVRHPWPAVTVGSVASPEDAVFADLDGDGAADVVSSCEGANRSVFVHWAPRHPAAYMDPHLWTTEAFPSVRGRAMWMFAVPIRAENRDRLDLAIGGKGQGAVIGLLRAPAKPREVSDWTFQPLHEVGWVMSLRCDDIDRDGDPDILASDRKGDGRGVFWLENPRRAAALAAAQWPVHPIGATGKEVMFLDLGDLDGDQRLDVVVAVKPRRVVLLRQPSDPRNAWTENTVELPEIVGTAKAVGLGDLDLDGKLDVVFSCEEAKGGKLGVVWFPSEVLLTGKTPPVHDISGPDGAKFDRLELIDLDGDGDLDVLTTEEAEALGVIWYENAKRP
ncbi:MAG: VCBS repeat-containing protein [Verrucomicrobia bacterium]|nr:VCBS repeat-containing protein [Verrucomicrobiota bacterium]